jgi:hypothetical protein
MNLLMRPVRLANGIDEEALLVFGEDERLLAILTHLGDEHGASSGLPGGWLRAVLWPGATNLHHSRCGTGLDQSAHS